MEGKNPSWSLKLEDNKSNWGRKEGCCACGKVEPLRVFESENKIINLITNIGALNQINEAEWNEHSVLRTSPALLQERYIKEVFLY